ncbi:MAG TPA: 50S ribosomal protein L29 [Sulfurovum sp.]|nr:50S ribosomal protein L29 [Sulfurovum sp.]
MKYTDISDKSVSVLEKTLKEKKLELFTLKAKLKTMQLTNTSELRDAKKDIARIQTAITAARSK